jgi:hypothetical protein
MGNNQKSADVIKTEKLRDIRVKSIRLIIYLLYNLLLLYFKYYSYNSINITLSCYRGGSISRSRITLS